MNKSESYIKVYKKQFRLFDVYHYIATGEQSHIKGISSYTASTCALQVIYDSPKVYSDGTFFYENEEELKKAISKINKCLNNCHKSGKKVNK